MLFNKEKEEKRKMDLFSIPLILLYAILFGTTMKIADLLDEHGLKWFKGSALLFGVLWGGFGALLILSSNLMANICLALVLAFVLRCRIDYLNHGIAAIIMFLTFFITQTINWNPFLIFFSVFAVAGLFHDYIQQKEYPRNAILKFLKKLLDLRSHYYILSFIYSILTGIWIVFFAVSLFMLSYELTLRHGMKIIEKQRKTLR